MIDYLFKIKLNDEWIKCWWKFIVIELVNVINQLIRLVIIFVLYSNHYFNLFENMICDKIEIMKKKIYV